MPISKLTGASRVPAIVLLSSAALLLAGCDSGQPRAQSGPPPAPQVTVAKPAKRLVAERDEYVGRFVAVDAIEVRARVSGYLDAVHFWIYPPFRVAHHAPVHPHAAVPD